MYVRKINARVLSFGADSVTRINQLGYLNVKKGNTFFFFFYKTLIFHCLTLKRVRFFRMEITLKGVFSEVADAHDRPKIVW